MEINYTSTRWVNLAPTNDINTKVAVSLLTSISYFYASVKAKGLGFFTRCAAPTPIFLPINILKDFTKPLSLSFRLFGNVLADEIVVSVLCLSSTIYTFTCYDIRYFCKFCSSFSFCYSFSLYWWIARIIVQDLISHWKVYLVCRSFLKFLWILLSRASVIAAGLKIGLVAIGPGIGQGSCYPSSLRISAPTRSWR